MGGPTAPSTLRNKRFIASLAICCPIELLFGADAVVAGALVSVVEAVLAVMKHNIETSKAMIREAVRTMPESRTCSCGDALRNTIMTPEKLIPVKTKKDLAPIIGKYMKNK